MKFSFITRTPKEKATAITVLEKLGLFFGPPDSSGTETDPYNQEQFPALVLDTETSTLWGVPIDHAACDPSNMLITIGEFLKIVKCCLCCDECRKDGVPYPNCEISKEVK
jgi:hypothetical protein